jgi:hypothetical protein
MKLKKRNETELEYFISFFFASLSIDLLFLLGRSRASPSFRRPFGDVFVRDHFEERGAGRPRSQGPVGEQFDRGESCDASIRQHVSVRARG